MRIPRIFSARRLQTGESVALDEQARRHLTRVLRLKKGDPIVLFDGSGCDFDARLTHLDKGSTLATPGEVIRREDPPLLRIHLVIGISRGERMDFAIQKAVELGVWSIQPLFTERTVVRLGADRLRSRESHWDGVIRHACEQSGRSLVPKLQPALPYAQWLAGFQGAGILLDHRADAGLRSLARPESNISLLVGPEGGLSATERTAASKQHFHAVRLGPRVLRTETAPLAAIAALQTIWGDFDCRG